MANFQVNNKPLLTIQVDFFTCSNFLQRAVAGSYAYFPKALRRLSPIDVVTRLWVFLCTLVAQLESSV